MIERRYIGKTV